jgi:hypothetical protein
MAWGEIMRSSRRAILQRSARRHRSGEVRDEHGSATLALLAGAALGIITALLVWLVILMQDKPDAAGQAPATTAVAPVKTLTVAPPTKATTAPAESAPTVLGDVRGLPAGLFCRDLNSKGYSYVAAIDYWRIHGQPNQMDADRNGIPCETVYARGDIGKYWNGRDIVGAAPLPAGLFCRDLAARGASYAEAVAYWWSTNMPARMDADGNSIPCETVYSTAAVNNFWHP